MDKSLGKHLGNDLNLKGVPNWKGFLGFLFFLGIASIWKVFPTYYSVFLENLGNGHNLKGVPSNWTYSDEQRALGNGHNLEGVFNKKKSKN